MPPKLAQHQGQRSGKLRAQDNEEPEADSRWELFLKRGSKKVVGGECYRQGSSGSYRLEYGLGALCLTGLRTWTIILGSKKFYELLGKPTPKHLPF